MRVRQFTVCSVRYAGQRCLLALFVLAWLCCIMQPIEAYLRPELPSDSNSLELGALSPLDGGGAMIGLLGGFRPVLANLICLEMYRAWEQRDREELERLIPYVTRLNPHSESIWLQVARYLAYDVAHWSIEAEGGPSVVSSEEQAMMHQQQALAALALLDSALNYHPQSVKLHMEYAQIYLNRLGDYATASEWLYRASQLPQAPDYIARIYADTRVEMGQMTEALNFLKTYSEQRYAEAQPRWIGKRISILKEQLGR